MSGKLDLSQFETDNKKLLRDKEKIKRGRPFKDENERRSKKIQIAVTEEEYNKLHQEFINSGFPTNFSNYMRWKLEKMNVL